MQKWIRGGLLVVGLMALGAAIGAGWLISTINWPFYARLQVEKAAFENRVELAEVYLGRRQAIEEQRLIGVRGLRVDSDNFVAPAADALGWASAILNRHAAAAGLIVNAIVPISGRPAPWLEDPRSPRVLVTYPVRIDLVGTEAQLIRFFSSLERENAYLCVVSLTMLDRRGADTRRITTVVEWPAWGENARSEHLRRLMSTVR